MVELIQNSVASQESRYTLLLQTSNACWEIVLFANFLSFELQTLYIQNKGATCRRGHSCCLSLTIHIWGTHLVLKNEALYWVRIKETSSLNLPAIKSQKNKIYKREHDGSNHGAHVWCLYEASGGFEERPFTSVSSSETKACTILSSSLQSSS